MSVISGGNEPGVFRRAWDSDLGYSFRRSKVAVVAGIITFIYLFAALFAPWIAPHDPYDMVNVSIIDAFLPPAWIEGGDSRFLLGTDNVGRGVLSTIIHGSRISLGVGFASVFLAYIRPNIMRILTPKDGYELDASPNIQEMGITWFIAYLSIAVFIHHTVYFLVEVMSFANVKYLLLKILLSSAITIILLFSYHLLARTRNKKATR